MNKKQSFTFCVFFLQGRCGLGVEARITNPIYAIIFPSPGRLVRRHPVRVAEYFVRSCNNVVHQTAEAGGVIAAVASGGLVVMLQKLVFQICWSC